MSAVAVAIAGSALVGAYASNKAAKTQAGAAQQAGDQQLAMFQQNKQDLAPWAQGGQVGQSELMRLLGIGGTNDNPTFNQNALLVKPFDGTNFQTDPSYQWRLQQGENALLNNASALGGLGGGNTMKALNNYAQGAASQEYQNAYNRYNINQQNIYNRIAGLSNTGVNAAGGVASLGANAANLQGNYITQGANAQAAGIVGQTNAIGGGLNQLSNQWLQANALQQQQGTQQMQYIQQGQPAQGYIQQDPQWVSQG